MRIFTVLVLALVFMMPGGAMAYTDFTFNIGVPNTALSPYAGPYLKVTVSQQTGNTANFDVVSQTSGNYLYLFGDGGAFAANFNLGSGTVSLGNYVFTGWDNAPVLDSVESGNNISEFGVMNTSLKFHDGYHSALSELKFTATLTGATWSDSDSVLVANSTKYFAAAHIFPQDMTNPSCGPIETGFAGNGNVPIPPTALLLGSGLLGIGLLGWRRKRQDVLT